MIDSNLPPCLRVAVYEGRAAGFASSAPCGHVWKYAFGIVVGRIVEVAPCRRHPEFLVPWIYLPPESECVTNDPEEAERAWVQAQELLLR